ncbi:hypothetical protein G9A89_011308 [Geosiphon pyriformis]|nr:hypothetical protein G9A89_011308 [Geosiphon pyriformis]
MKNMIAEEINYADLNALEIDDKMDNTTPRKTCTRTYVLSSKPNKIFFNDLSDGNNNVLTLPAFKFSGTKHLLAAELCVLDKCDFGPVKFFTLDVELSAVPGKTNSNKLMAIKKIFYQIDEFGRGKVRELATHEKIVINVDVRQVNKHLDQVIIVKEISVDLPKSAVESVFFKFGKIVSIKMQLIDLWQKTLVEFELSEIADLVTARWFVVMGKDSVHVVKAINNKHIWLYDRKTCFIGCNPNSYVYNRCAIVCFIDKTSKLAAIGSAPVFKSVNLHWAGLSLAHCAHCKQFGHISTTCLLDGNFGIHILLGTLGSSLFSGTKLALIDSSSFDNFYLVDWLVSLECSLELLMDQVSGIMKKLSFVKLMLLASKSLIPPLVVLVSVAPNLDFDMTLNIMMVFPSLLLSIVADSVSDLGLSSSKVLMSKVNELKSKIVALEVLVESVLEKLNHLCSGLGSSTSLIPQ